MKTKKWKMIRAGRAGLAGGLMAIAGMAAAQGEEIPPVESTGTVDRPSYTEPQENRGIDPESAVSYLEATRQQIINDIQENKRVSSQLSDISVNLENGRFVITGMVDSERHRDTIMDIAQKRVGKDRVENQMGIKPPRD
jgi:osmotically-inducible protein OsmY